MSSFPIWSRACIIAMLSIGVSTGAMACRCNEAGLDTAYDDAESIVLGTVLSVDRKTDFNVSYSVAVSEAWKKRPGERLTIVSRGTCIYRAEVGRQYLLYLRPYERGGYQTSRCAGNEPETNAARALNFLRAKKR